MANGRLRPSLHVRTQRAIRSDRHVFARIFRGRRGEEQPVASFVTRIAAVAQASLSRDLREVIGDAGPQMKVLSAPAGILIRKRDEVWADGERYRVIAVDAYPGNTQVLVQHIQ